jgi:hypothetical protein
MFYRNYKYDSCKSSLIKWNFRKNLTKTSIIYINLSAQIQHMYEYYEILMKET